MATRILLADDHKILRDGLHLLISKQNGLKVIGEAENGLKAVAMALKLSPDIVLMDIGMPYLNGTESTRQITNHDKNIRVIGLSMHSDRRYVSEMLKAGASGYLVKNSAFEELTEAIHTVMMGCTYLSPVVAKAFVKEYRRDTTVRDNSAFAVLTERERQVLQLIAEGRKTREIADCLYISIKTVETHRMHIMKKLSLTSIAELTKYAIREGLASLEPN